MNIKHIKSYNKKVVSWKEVFEKRYYGLGSAMSILYLYITIVICWVLYSVMVARGKNED